MLTRWRKSWCERPAGWFIKKKNWDFHILWTLDSGQHWEKWVWLCWLGLELVLHWVFSWFNRVLGGDVVPYYSASRQPVLNHLIPFHLELPLWSSRKLLLSSFEKEVNGSQRRDPKTLYKLHVLSKHGSQISREIIAARGEIFRLWTNFRFCLHSGARSAGGEGQPEERSSYSVQTSGFVYTRGPDQPGVKGSLRRDPQTLYKLQVLTTLGSQISQ